MSSEKLAVAVPANIAKGIEVEAGGSPYRWRVLIMTWLAYLYDSLDLQILAICMPVIISDLKISLVDAGLLASATMIGTLIGGILFGWIAENYGRKKAAVWGLMEFGIFTILVYWVDSWAQLMVLRFLQGIGIGGLWGPIVALIADHWKPQYRARAAGFMLSTFALGGILAAIMGRLMLGSVGWRWIFLLTGSAIFAAILFQVLVPADPKPQKGIKKESVSLSALFEGRLAKITIMATIAAACQMGGFWGVASWVPTYLVKERGLSIEYMSYFSLVIFAGAFVGYYLYAYIADKIGRRKALLIAFLADAIIVPLYVFIPNALFLFWLGPVMGLSFGGIFGLFGAYFAELFPVNLRAMGPGFAFNVGRGVGAVIMPYTVGALAKANGLGFGIGMCSLIFLTGAITVFFMSETLNAAEAK
jgi:MFS family permease